MLAALKARRCRAGHRPRLSPRTRARYGWRASPLMDEPVRRAAGEVEGASNRAPSLKPVPNEGGRAPASVRGYRATILGRHIRVRNAKRGSYSPPLFILSTGIH